MKLKAVICHLIGWEGGGEGGGGMGRGREEGERKGRKKGRSEEARGMVGGSSWRSFYATN